MVNLIPSNFIPQLYNDFKTLNEYRKVRSGNNSIELTSLSDLQKKSYAAAYRILGTTFIGLGGLMAAKIILPILTFKFCLGVAVSVALAVLGRDIFTISKKREEKQNEAEMPSIVDFKSYLKGPAQIYEDTFVPAVWMFLQNKV